MHGHWVIRFIRRIVSMRSMQSSGNFIHLSSTTDRRSMALHVRFIMLPNIEHAAGLQWDKSDTS
jgi:hypothetical protein